MKRTFFSLGLVGAAVAWLVLSYLPADFLPVYVAFPIDAVQPLFRTLVRVSAVVFVAVQLILIASVFKFPQRVSRHDFSQAPHSSSVPADESRLHPSDIRISHKLEFLWTALPLLTSLGLFAISYWAIGA